MAPRGHLGAAFRTLVPECQVPTRNGPTGSPLCPLMLINLSGFEGGKRKIRESGLDTKIDRQIDRLLGESIKNKNKKTEDPHIIFSLILFSH